MKNPFYTVNLMKNASLCYGVKCNNTSFHRKPSLFKSDGGEMAEVKMRPLVVKRGNFTSVKEVGFTSDKQNAFT